MLFSEFIQSQHPRQYSKLTDLQLQVLAQLDKQKSRVVIEMIFSGRKACPYRILQHLWNSYLSHYPNTYSEVSSS